MKKFLIVIAATTAVQSLSAQDVKNLQILSFKTKKETMDFMKKTIAPSVGVKCSYCHNVRDFPSDEKNHKKITREMMLMTQRINENTIRRFPMSAEKAVLYAKENSDRFLEELKELVAIPSVSSDSNCLGEMKACAKFVENAISSIGFDRVEMVETKKHPIVHGEWLGAPGAPTVLLYGHYDVQPVDPLELWETPPFEASERDGRLYGRGTVDDKGQFYLHLKAMESWLSSSESLPVNMKVIIEGEEEVGSESLEPFLDDNREMLSADVAVISDTSMIKKGWPSITYGLRGIAYFQIDLKGPSQDLHSGIFGGAVKNPIHALTEIIGKLKDENGRISIPGLYDDVVEVTSEERADMAELPFEEELFLEEVGAPRLSWESGYTPLESLWCRPALDVNGIWGGFSGEGSKTVIPSEAHAKVSIRLVPNQEPDVIGDLLEAYVKDRSENARRSSVPGGSFPSRVCGRGQSP